MGKVVNGILERLPHWWLNRLPYDLRERIRSLYLHSTMMHRIIGAIETTPDMPETELLWRALCATIEQNNDLMKEIVKMRSEHINPPLILQEEPHD